MSKTKITNRSKTPFRLPKGKREFIEAGATVSVADWDESKDNLVVRAWLNAKKLVVGGAETSDEGSGDGEGSGTGGDGNAEREAELRAKTIPELTEFLEKAGQKDKVKSGMNKDDLIALALEVK